jgi:hypothetical protein
MPLINPPPTYKVWGVRIDTTNSNPLTSVTPTDDSISGLPLNFGERPCLLKDGVVQYYLDEMNFTKKADGSNADIISGNDGDIMIEIPRLAYFIAYEGNDLIVKVTNHQDAKQIDPRFRYYGHTINEEGDCEELYYGAYQGCEIGGRLRSLSGKAPLHTNTIAQFRTKARAHGEGYGIVSFYPITLLEAMYIVRYCNLNSQSVLGLGVSSGTTAINTGGTETWGMYGGTQSDREHVKFAGIEDWFGNLWDRFDGVQSAADFTLLTAFTNFNDEGTGYKAVGKFLNAVLSVSYLKKPFGTSEVGFWPAADGSGGSSETFFCDAQWYNSSRVGGFFGGRYGHGAVVGAFTLNLNDLASYSSASTGSRLQFLKPGKTLKL